MRKYLFLFLSFSLISFSISARELTKEQKKAIKEKLKDFKKYPEKYDNMINRYKETIDSNEAQITRDKENNDQLANNLSALETKLTTLQADLKALQNKPVPTCPECPTAATIPSKGVIYKVQLGLFKKFDMNGYFTKPKFVGVEGVDKMNRYVISYFDTKEESERFVKDLRKLGLKGAFSAKYEDGQRVFEKGGKAPASASGTHPHKAHKAPVENTTLRAHSEPKVIKSTTDRAKPKK
jgi:hypothetical protein